MNYKFILIFAGVIIHVNGHTFGRSGGGRGFSSTPVRGSFSSTPARTFSSFSENSPRFSNSLSSSPPGPVFSSLSLPRTVSSRSITPSQTFENQWNARSLSYPPPPQTSQIFGNAPNARGMTYPPPHPPPYSPPPQRPETFGNPTNARGMPYLPPPQGPQIFGDSPNGRSMTYPPPHPPPYSPPPQRPETFGNPTNARSMPYPPPSQAPQTSENTLLPSNSGKITPATSSNSNFGFFKGMPRNNLDQKFDNTGSTSKQDVKSIDLKNPTNIPSKSSLTPVTSNNSDFGFLKALPRNNLDKKLDNPSLADSQKSNTESKTNVQAIGSNPINSKNPANKTSVASNNASNNLPQNNLDKKFENSSLAGNVNLNVQNNIGGISEQPKIPNSGSQNDLIKRLGLSSLNSLPKLKTGHNKTHIQNSTNNLKQTNKTVDMLLKDIEAVRKNLTDVKQYLNTTNSQAKDDISWIQKQLDHGVDKLHEINTSKNRINSTYYNTSLSLMNDKILNLSAFIKLMNSSNYIGHKNYTNYNNTGSLSDLKNHLKPPIKKAYSNSATYHSHILKSLHQVPEYDPKHSSAINHVGSQMIIAMSLIISILIVI